jgi:hypothetical protein
MEAFVYKWTNVKTGKYYIGKHKGTEDDGYISSGKSFLSAYVLEPEHFRREILFRGTDKECLNKEQSLIQEAINNDGRSKIYNLTIWAQYNSWKRTCTWCGAIVDPLNEEWVDAFSMVHFENCLKNPINVKNATIDGLTLPKIEKKIKQLLILNTKESGYKYQFELRKLRENKKKLLKLRG